MNIFLIALLIIIFGSLAIIFIQKKFKLFTLFIHPWLKKHSTLLSSYRSILAFVGFPIIILGGIYSYVQIIERIEQPVVGLNFVYKENTAVMVRNLSKAVIEKPKYHVALFNLDENINERSNPLPIPVAMGDYIRPEDGWGPNSMLSIPSVTKRVNSGDRLIGWALVTCPKCPIKYYWVYIQKGKGGWYAELKEDEFIYWNLIQELIRTPERAIKAYENKVSKDRRIYIK